MKFYQKVINKLISMNFFGFLSDKQFLKLKYKIHMDKKLNLKNPQTFNEKLQWLKLNDRKPEYTKMVDKYAVREYISKKIGEEYLIPLLGVWDNVEDIDFDKLPNQFVLKCNHDSGGLVICRDKASLDIEQAKKTLSNSMKRNFYKITREWPYKNVKKKIVAEDFMEDKNGAFIDYKFFCFNGNVHSVMICMDRHLGDTKFYFFDREWKLLKLNIRGKNAPEGFTVEKPECIEKMFQIAEELSSGIPFSRVDMYECDGKIYFGEITFYPASGFDANLLTETDIMFGDLINLEEIE